MDIDKRSLGQAYNKSQTRIYTWWSDGSVTYHDVEINKGMTWFGVETIDTSKPPHDLRHFYAFVPTVAPAAHEQGGG